MAVLLINIVLQLRQLPKLCLGPSSFSNLHISQTKIGFMAVIAGGIILFANILETIIYIPSNCRFKKTTVTIK